MYIDTALQYELKEVLPLWFFSEDNSRLWLRRVAKRNNNVVKKQEKITILKHLNLNFIVYFNYYLSFKALVFDKWFAPLQQDRHSEQSTIQGVFFRKRLLPRHSNRYAGYMNYVLTDFTLPVSMTSADIFLLNTD